MLAQKNIKLMTKDCLLGCLDFGTLERCCELQQYGFLFLMKSKFGYFFREFLNISVIVICCRGRLLVLGVKFWMVAVL